ncbi:MAG: rhomboid family intramembrane serine protease [Thermoleophilia bacterium]
MFPLKDNIPTDRTPFVTIAFIVINVFAYFVLQRGGILSGPSDSGVIDYGAIPYEITNPGQHCALAGEQVVCEGQPGVQGTAPEQPATILTIFTSMFMHGSILHLGGNMLFLWIFGNNVEDSMGHLKFVAFYVLGGVAALLGQTVVDVSAAVPTIGASGAVAAVLGGYILLYPHARVVTIIFIVFFFTILELPALLVLGLWFVLQLFYGAAEVGSPAGGGGGVAYFAHIGGFVFGLLLIKLFASREKDYTVPPKYPVY